MEAQPSSEPVVETSDEQSCPSPNNVGEDHEILTGSNEGQLNRLSVGEDEMKMSDLKLWEELTCE